MMNEDVLCIYYSRTGRTRRTLGEIAEALDCACVELRDERRRSGALGYLRCGLDAMRKRTHRIVPLETPRPLSDYRLVILGTPVWAGRCSSVMRALLKRRGYEMRSVAYVLTHKSEEPYRDIFRQMDLYLLAPHVAEASLVPGSKQYEFWRNDFIKSCQVFLESEA